MKAVVLQEKLQLSSTHPLPVREKNGALIRPTLVGICKTDLELVKGYMGFRGVLGHEFVGVVEDCSDAAWIGKRVVGEINCSPRDRIVSDPRHQDHRTVLGILGRDGVMAQKFALPTENLLQVPAGLSDEQAVFTEPLAAAYEIHEQLAEIPGSALILGDGKLGALCALALADSGCRVTLVGKHQKKLDAVPGDLQKLTLDQLPATRYPLVVDATGSKDGLATALKTVQPRGTVILKTTVASPHQLDLSSLVIDEITILGSRCGKFSPALEAMAEGRIDPTFLIEKIYPFEQALEAFAHAARRGAAKILLKL